MEIKARFGIYKVTVLWGWWKLGALVLFITGFYDFLQGSYPSLRLPVLEQITGWFDWRIWIIIALLFAIIGTAEGTYRHIKKVKQEYEHQIDEIKEQFENDTAERHRLERKEQRAKFADASNVTKKLANLFMVIERIADKNCKNEPIPYEKLQDMATRLDQANVFKELADVFVKFAIVPSYGELEMMVEQSNHKLVAQTMRKLLYLINNAMSELGFGIRKNLLTNKEYLSLCDDIQQTIAGLPKSITSKVDEYIETAESINNMKYIELTEITQALSLNLISPVGTLLLQQSGQASRNYLNPLLAEIENGIETFLLGDEVLS